MERVLADAVRRCGEGDSARCPLIDAFIEVMRVSILDRIFGPEPPTPADLQREADHERLVGGFLAAGEATEPTKHRGA